MYAIHNYEDMWGLHSGKPIHVDCHRIYRNPNFCLPKESISLLIIVTHQSLKWKHHLGTTWFLWTPFLLAPSVPRNRTFSPQLRYKMASAYLTKCLRGFNENMNIKYLLSCIAHDRQSIYISYYYLLNVYIMPFLKLGFIKYC